MISRPVAPNGPTGPDAKRRIRSDLSQYEFLTTWVLDADREDVWDALWDAERWPQWWPGVEEAVETDPGTPCGVGRRGRYTWRSRVPYPVRFEVVATQVEPMHLLEGEVSGPLEGVGRWRLREDDGLTIVVYEWAVRTTKPWMNALAPVARPLFRWNHDQLMRRGGLGLARLLGARLIAAS